MGENDATADVLERAADLLWVRGRTYEYGERSDGTLCALGAVACALGRRPQEDTYEPSPAALALAEYLRAHDELWWHIPLWLLETEERCRLRHGTMAMTETVWRWNDATEDDSLVIDTLRRCGKSLRESSGA